MCNPYDPPQAEIAKQECESLDCKEQRKDLLCVIVGLAVLVGLFAATSLCLGLQVQSLKSLIESKGWKFY